MKNKNDCKIVQDLLPNYLENLTSKETTEFINEHLKDCSNCKNIFEEMQKSFNINIEKRDDREVEYIKKFNQKINILKIIVVNIVIVLLFETVIIFMLRYKQMQEELSWRYNKEINNAYNTFERNSLEQQKIEQLEKELSKYDSTYKNIVSINFIAELEDIIEDGNLRKLLVKGISPNINDKHYLLISDETEVVINDDVKDISDLKLGQILNIYFTSEEKEKYPEEVIDIKKIEVLDITNFEAKIKEINSVDDYWILIIETNDDKTKKYLYISNQTDIIKDNYKSDISVLEVGQTVKITVPVIYRFYPNTLKDIVKIEILDK